MYVCNRYLFGPWRNKLSIISIYHAYWLYSVVMTYKKAFTVGVHKMAWIFCIGCRLSTRSFWLGKTSGHEFHVTLKYALKVFHEIRDQVFPKQKDRCTRPISNLHTVKLYWLEQWLIRSIWCNAQILFLSQRIIQASFYQCSA
jgi:hypothetical protein